MVEAYPLYWPEGWKRTPSYNRTHSRFKTGFTYKKNQMCFACDRYRTVKENLTAIGKTIEALRGMERWGASDMMERAFRGFTALAASNGRDWWDVLQVRRDASREAMEANFRLLAQDRHPDRGGSQDAMVELNRAHEDARRELGVS
ncbi:MAG: J domain-containing protein [Terracidiphilus sp.]